ncbi:MULTISPECIES: hypothetical protein [Burkholderia cepacia complex]|uniref:hypothetical protein n=1 Tax=Burkholderia cepacia complex TaxID=87882 RepID=UPI001581B7EE|nr:MULTISPECIES: hypothetical protein [Burkholderia cepacia complex]
MQRIDAVDLRAIIDEFAIASPARSRHAGPRKHAVDHERPFLGARKYGFRTHDDTVTRVIDLATSKVSTVASPTHVERTPVHPFGLPKAAVARIDLY